MRLLSLLLGAACLLSADASFDDTTVKLITPNYTEVNKGHSVTIVCEFHHVDKQDIIIWKRSGDKPIFMDYDMAISDHRFDLSADETADANGRRFSNFTINNIDLTEDSIYYCGTMETAQYVGTRVKVTVPPTARITPELWPYTVLNLESVTLKCHAGGHPTPKVYWSKEGGSIASHVSIEGDTLRIPSVQKSDAGIYHCNANSTAGEATSSVDMRVHDPHVVVGGPSQPWIRTPFKYVPVDLNGKVNISCEYDGNPHPDIEWLFNGAKLTLNKEMVRNSIIKQYASRLANSSESILEINGASVEYFGDYSCRAVNNLGRVSTVVYVTNLPSPAEISLDGTILTMTAMAPNGIKQFDLFFRRTDENGWLNKKEIAVSKSDQTGEKTWSKQIDLMDFIDESGGIEVQVQAKNGYGSGNKAVDMIRTTLPVRSKDVPASAPFAGFSIAVVTALLILLAH